MRSHTGAANLFRCADNRAGNHRGNRIGVVVVSGLDLLVHAAPGLRGNVYTRPNITVAQALVLVLDVLELHFDPQIAAGFFEPV